MTEPTTADSTKQNETEPEPEETCMCPICISDINAEEEIVLSCGHCYHKKMLF